MLERLSLVGPLRSHWAEVRRLAHLSTPLIFSNLLTLVLVVTDVAFLGRVAAVELAAATLGSPVFMALQMPATGWATAVQVLVAQRAGAGQFDAVAAVLRLGVVVAVGVGGLVALALTIAAPGIASSLTRDVDLAARTTAYLRVIAIAVPAIGVFSVARAGCSGLARTGTVLRATLATALLNVPLNYLWIVLLGWGAVGSAIGTALSLLTGIAVLGWSLQSHLGSFLVRFHGVERWRETLLTMWRIGWPETTMLVVGYLNNVVVIGIVAQLGVIAVAAAGLLSSCLNVVWTVIFAISTGIAVRAGQRLGAGDLSGVIRCRDAGYVVMSAWVVALAAPLLLAPHQLASLLTTDPTTSEYAASVMPILVLAMPAMVVGMVLAGLLRAAGDTRSLLVAGTAGSLLVYVPAAWALGLNFGLGLTGVYLGAAAFWAVRCAITVYRFREGAWRTVVR